MVMDRNGMSHRPKGTPDGGRYDGGGDGVHAGDDVLPPGGDGHGTGPMDRLLAMASRLMRMHAIRDHTSVKSPEETLGLLREACRVEFGPRGAILYDRDGGILFREDPTVPHLDAGTMRRDPRVRAAVRDTFRNPLDDLPAADRRNLIRRMIRYAGPYERRLAVDSSPNRRYLPAATIARSLSRRRDRDQAARIMRELHYEDANASGNVIRAGYPDDKESAFQFINYTKIRRQPRDIVDKATGGIIARKGDAIRGEWVDRDGKRHEGVLPEPRGAAGRAYLRMLYQPTDGVPSRGDTDRMLHVFRRMADDEPRIQARTFWNLCYGNPERDDKWEDTNFMVRLIGQRTGDHEGARLVRQYMDRPGGQGNVARMLAYRKCMTHDAAVHFLAMTRGDDRDAHTQYPRVRGRGADRVEHMPKRLTEMRSFIHAVYEIPSREVEEYAAAHPNLDAPIRGR